MSMTMHGPVRTLSTPECALELLRSLAKGTTVNSNNTFRGAEQAYNHNNEPDVSALLHRLSDAWAWLESQAFLGPDPSQNTGWQRVTERGRSAANSTNALAEVVAEDRLAMSLHDRLESRIRPIFGLGDYETAAFAALKEVEIRVRNLSGATNSSLGVNLMRSAFKKDGGTLVDPGADPGEQVATMELIAGAIGTFKNPASHRTVDYRDPTEAAEAVLLADLHMRLLDRVEHRHSEHSPD